MKHLTEIKLANDRTIKAFNEDTCEYLIDLLNEITTQFPRGEILTFSSPVGKIKFEIG